MASAQKKQSLQLRHQSLEEERICWENLENPTPQVEPVYQWTSLTARQLQLCSVYAFKYTSLSQMLNNEQSSKNLKGFLTSSFPPLTEQRQTTSQERMREFYRQIVDLHKCGFQMSFCGQTIKSMIEMLEEQDFVIEMLINCLKKIIQVNINFLNINAKQLILRQLSYCLQFIDDQYKQHVYPFIQIKKQLEKMPKVKFRLKYSIQKSNQSSVYSNWAYQKYKQLYNQAKKLYENGSLTTKDEPLSLSDFNRKRDQFTKIDSKIRSLHKDMIKITQEAINNHVHNTKIVFELAKTHKQIQVHTSIMRKEIAMFLANTDSKAKSTIEKELECEKQLTGFLVQLLRLRDM